MPHLFREQHNNQQKSADEPIGIKREGLQIAQADVRFHDVILAASHNKRLVQMVNNLAERIYRYRLEYIKDTANHPRLIEEHARIMDCVINKDVDSACIAAEIHIVNQENVMLQQFVSEDR